MRDASTFGTYRLLEELGRGGQGTVWLAEDTRLKRRVALKVLSTAAGALGDDQVARFRREAEAASKLDHPNVCGLLDAGDVDGTPYLAYRFVEGHTLAEQIAQSYARREGIATDRDIPDAPDPSSRAGIEKITALFEKLARALHVAHEKGLVHRDVKPGNVMITPDGEPVLLDFGLARDELGDDLSLTHSGDLLGTPAYMSPEQLTAHRVPLDRRTDVYSLGATLYEALTLQKPFTGRTRAELYQRILAADPSSVSALNRQIPHDLRVVVETAIDKDRNRRYQTALAFAEDLRRFRQFEPVKARPIGRLLKARRWVQRQPVVATIVIAVLLLLTTGLGISLHFLGQVSAEQRAALAAALRSRALALAAESARAMQEDQMLAMLLAREAVRIESRPETLSQLYEAVANVYEQKWFDFRGESVPDIDGCVLSPDGRRFVARGYLCGIDDAQKRALWDASAGQGSEGVDFSPDGRLLVTNTRDGALIRSVEGDLEVPLSIENTRAHIVRFSPSGSRVATVAGSSAILWDTNGKPLRELRHDARIGALAFAPRPGDDRVLTASGSQWDPHDLVDCSVRLWSGERDDPVVLEGHKDGIWSVRFSLDGQHAVSASSDKTARVWDLVTGASTVLEGHRDIVLSAEFSPDNARVLTASFDDTARVWDVKTGRELAVLRHEGGVQSARYSADGQRIVTASYDRTVRVFAASGQPLLVLRGHANVVHRAMFTPNGNRIVSCSRDGTVRVWEISRPEMPLLWLPGERIVEVVPIDTESILISSRRGPVWTWNPADLAPSRLVGPRNVGGKVDVSPRGSALVLSADRSRTGAELWTLKSGVEATLAQLFAVPANVRDVAFTPSGRRVLAASQLPYAVLWSLDGREERRYPHLAPDSELYLESVDAFGEDDDLILTAGGSTAALWERDGTLLRRFKGHLSRVYDAAFSHDGSLVATASTDGTAGIWDALRGDRLQEIPVGSGVRFVRWSRDDRRLLIAATQTIVWDVAEERRVFAVPGGGARYSLDGDRIFTRNGGLLRSWPSDPAKLIELADEYAFRGFTEDERRRFADLLR